MKILVINAGSSSLKYQLLDMTDESVIAKGNCERIGLSGSVIGHKTADGRSFKVECPMPTHNEAFEKLVEMLTTGESKCIDSLSEISAVGHRIVQGAEVFTHSCLVDDDVVDKIEGLSDLAPLHNPGAVLAIRACQKVFGKEVPMVVVFDTSFHSTMPPKAYLYGLPHKYYDKYKVRKYGFHGTSHRFITGRYAELTGCDITTKKLITCHLGNGSSITAVQGGKCVDTSMGFTPLDGLIMGTRSGAIDASAVLYIMKQENLSPDEMNTILNKQSGFLGVSELSSDTRDLLSAADQGNKHAAEALDMLMYEIKKFIGSYAAAMGGVDAICFTGGIGENNAMIREKVLEGLEFMGVKVDHDLNEKYDHNEGCFSTPNSKVEAWVIPTNEELLIARDTKEIVEQA